MSRDRSHHIREEIANALTHGVGFGLSIIALVVLVFLGLKSREPIRIIAALVYGLSMVNLYGSSMFYHSSRVARRKRVLQILDHCAIYLFIAGTYTPFMLITVGGWYGWSLLAAVWLLGLGGVYLKLYVSRKATRVSTASYVLMGWICALALKPLYLALPTNGFWLLVAGGLVYTAGVYFFVKDRDPFRHAVWHLFVLLGSVCHFLAIAIYVIPG